ncbi:MAG TPA: folylpolyglutamate synthase/dihydrofolate synthase family protein [Thermodesulfobacteriota bacterium]|nr:folylpolyglutamate synthase/dihydrofolate synthase family protein [Thermodesulfobacteriota bacterium]
MTKGNDRSSSRNDYTESLDYLYSLQKFGMIFGLTQVTEILEAIGNPHEEIQAIHVGGTNGKGSTAAMMASVLQKEGYRVGLYTSPHLIRFSERIKVNGVEIREDEVAALTGWMKERIEASGIPSSFTFFDFTTAMAFRYFSQKRVDLAILEVGLGGRLDSTNVIDPLLSIITNVTRDHEEILGESILKIAEEKAGIIKKGRPLITAATQPQVVHLFSRLCRKKNAPLYRVSKDFRYEPIGERNFHYEGLHRKLWGVRLNLSGLHQIVNATIALGALEILEDSGYPVSTESMIEGLREVDWPGRLEMISSSPRVLLDGAHNPAGAMVLKASLKKEFQFHRLILLLGIMKDKDFRSVLKTLAPLADHIILSKPHMERASSPSLLLDQLGDTNGKKAEIVEDLPRAIEKGLSLTQREDLFCITGSLYTVGEARDYLLSGERS